MRALLAILAASVALPTPSPPRLEDGTCNGMARPTLATFTVFDPNAVRYAGFGVEGEPVTAWEPQPDVLELADGVEYRFHDAGTATAKACPGSTTRWYNEVANWVPASYPQCWRREVTREGNCADPPPEDPGLFAPEPLHCDAAGADPGNCIEPGYDEHHPTGPVDGPGEGPGQGTPADKPAP